MNLMIFLLIINRNIIRFISIQNPKSLASNRWTKRHNVFWSIGYWLSIAVLLNVFSTRIKDLAMFSSSDSHLFWTGYYELPLYRKDKKSFHDRAELLHSQHSSQLLGTCYPLAIAGLIQ